MNAAGWGILFGLTFGIIDVLIMLPLKFDTPSQKNEAMAAAFIDRFMLGFLIPVVNLPINPIIIGIFLGLGLSLPSAVISKTYAPIVGIGVIGGALIGFLTTLLM